ncbi:MAG: prolyl-tRNA synthetase associated domain-containing protein [Pseudomonadota bacterium]|nr:prolyl-tRNA synthetase associated domain-containing protein [Pseudomonadota bacterium]
MTSLEAPVLARLDALGIAYTVHRHPAVYTVEAAKVLRGDVGAAHAKNLFLRDKREQMWLLTVLEDRPVDFRALREVLDTRGTPSFGSPERLRTWLGVTPGSVTPLAAINDTGCGVRVVLDAALRDYPLVGVHPNHNEATVTLAPADLVRFLESTGHPPTWLEGTAGTGAP